MLRHLPPEAIEDLLPCIQTFNERAGDVVFRAGEAGDALYIVASGTVEVIAGGEADDIAARRIAQLTEGETFGRANRRHRRIRCMRSRGASQPRFGTISGELFVRHPRCEQTQNAIAVRRSQ